MSSFEDRVSKIINDRVNDLERLFLTSSETSDTPSGMEDCCKDVLSKLNQIKDLVEQTQKDVDKLDNSSDPLTEETIREILQEANQPSGDPSKEQLEHKIDDYVNEHGIPYSFKDFLDLIGAILGGAIAVADWPTFLRWLFKLLPYLLLSGKAWIPLLSLIVGLWRGLQDRIDNAALITADRSIIAQIDQLTNKLDDLSELVHEMATGMQPSPDVGQLLQYLRRIYDTMEEYYRALDDRLTTISNRISSIDQRIEGLISSQSTDTMILRSDIACVAQWLKGSRNCDDFGVDLYTVVDQLNARMSEISCHLDDYYQSLATSLANCCVSMSQKFDHCSEELERIKSELTNPDSPVNNTNDMVERGNVVGTGSIVLNQQNDLNVIKAMLFDIRRLL